MKRASFILIILLLFSCKSNRDEATVQYFVNGSNASDIANIQYTFGDNLISLPSSPASLPWEYTYKLWTDSEDTYTAFLSTENLSTNPVTLEIIINGKIKNQVTFSDQNVTKSIQVVIDLWNDNWD